MKTALGLRDYEDVLDAGDIYSLLGVLMVNVDAMLMGGCTKINVFRKSLETKISRVRIPSQS